MNVKIKIKLTKPVSKLNKIFQRFSKNPLLYFGTTAILLFGILFIASPSTPGRGDFSFLEALSAGQNSRNLFLLSQNLAVSPGFTDLSLVQESSLKAVSPPNIVRFDTLGTLADEAENNAEENKEIVEYIVEEGDSLWSLAKKFGVSKETIISANNIKNSIIKPKQKLLILPVDGVMHLVKSGDTVADLASKYKAEAKEIIEFNQLTEDGDLFVGEFLIIPGGKMVNEPKSSTRATFADMSGRKHYYPWGWCTWWIEHKRPIPTNWGNATNWLDRAQVQSFNVCKGSSCAPQAGAIVSLITSNPMGHVAYVEEVKGDTVIFSEMNYYGFGETNWRRLKIGDSRIKGYIY